MPDTVRNKKSEVKFTENSYEYLKNDGNGITNQDQQSNYTGLMTENSFTESRKDYDYIAVDDPSNNGNESGNIAPDYFVLENPDEYSVHKEDLKSDDYEIDGNRGCHGDHKIGSVGEHDEVGKEEPNYFVLENSDNLNESESVEGNQAVDPEYFVLENPNEERVEADISLE